MMTASSAKKSEFVKELHNAVDKNDVTKLRQIFDGKDPSVVLELCLTELKPYGSLLHHAAGVANVKVINMVLETGIEVNINQLDSHVTQKQTPLHIAALAGKHDAVRVLLSRGADVTARESEGLTPLHCACSGNDLTTVELLLKAGASVNETDSRGQYPLQRSILRSSNAITKVIIQHGADINIKDDCNQTVLHYAVEWDNVELVKIFLDSGISTNVQDSDGRSPLHLAEEEDIKKLLIQHGGDVNLRDSSGRPVVEQQLDMEKEEYQRINALLEKRLKPPEIIDPAEGRMADVQEKINQMVLPSGEDYKTARVGMMNELLEKSKNPDGE